MLFMTFFLVKFLCFKQKTAYEVRISDWISDVCSSDLTRPSTRSPPSSSMSIRLKALASPRSRVEIEVPPCTTSIGRPGCAPGNSCMKDRKSVVSGKSVSVRVDLGGRRIIKKKKDKAWKYRELYELRQTMKIQNRKNTNK